MKTDNINEIFKDLDFDLAEPKEGHKDRFMEKLKATQQKAPQRSSKVRSLWAPFIGVAAAVALAFLLFGNAINTGVMAKSGDLASVSPEMKETQNFYTNLIEAELHTLQEEKTPETEVIVEDALAQMEKLETEYSKLKKDLLKSGKDKRVIYAMISNFQQRIDLLKNVLEQIENIKNLKTQQNENNII
ncbi:DUF4179 domain-containing protein [Salegentibacter chungangensis]|uniref:DUF4179 domain-containing protein n=1 Tax=Salegentibacter chungangensis TaxID=1335724 RepID=A0ABW3NSM9_9FLAO